MKTNINEVIDIHQLALDLSYTESKMLYDILDELTLEFQTQENGKLYIPNEIFHEYYPELMFRFMTLMINSKCL